VKVHFQDCGGYGTIIDRNLTRYLLIRLVIPCLLTCKNMVGYGKILDRNLTRYFMSFLVNRLLIDL
jgi:hypothetical protein